MGRDAPNAFHVRFFRNALGVDQVLHRIEKGLAAAMGRLERRGGLVVAAARHERLVRSFRPRQFVRRDVAGRQRVRVLLVRLLRPVLRFRAAAAAARAAARELLLCSAQRRLCVLIRVRTKQRAQHNDELVVVDNLFRAQVQQLEELAPALLRRKRRRKCEIAPLVALVPRHAELGDAAVWPASVV